MPHLSEIDSWLRLTNLEFGSKRMRALMQAFGNDPEALFAAGHSGWKERLPDLTEKQLSQLASVRDLDLTKQRTEMDKLGVSVISANDPVYPANLKPLPDAPPVLMARGALQPEDKFSIAIVGSRRASAYGLSLAKRFAKDLASHGFTVVSGGARGIDTAAHTGALEANGRTLAFLGCGLDVNYPAENKKLFDRIVEAGGALLSEYPLGARPEPWRFPARNRLVSGTTLGVLVIESPANSGALITAREAGDQGREVFAIPGPIDTGRNAGCHKLIQDGAKLVETLDDILSELGVLTLRSPEGEPHPMPPAAAGLPPEQRRILDMLTLQPRQVDGMISASGLTAPQVTGILTLLEMRGLARRVPGNAFVRVL